MTYVKATLKEIGTAGTTAGWCIGVAWRTRRARARVAGVLPAVGTVAQLLFSTHHREAAHNVAIVLRARGFAAQSVGLRSAPTDDGRRVFGWAVAVPIITPIDRPAGFVAAPRFVHQGAIARRDAIWIHGATPGATICRQRSW